MCTSESTEASLVSSKWITEPGTYYDELLMIRSLCPLFFRIHPIRNLGQDIHCASTAYPFILRKPFILMGASGVKLQLSAEPRMVKTEISSTSTCRCCNTRIFARSEVFLFQKSRIVEFRTKKTSANPSQRQKQPKFAS